MANLMPITSQIDELLRGFFVRPMSLDPMWQPGHFRADVWETENEIVYAFDLPGLSEDTISIEAHDDTLTVSGEREKTTETEGDRFYRYERRYGSFARAVGLPAGVDDAKITASYKDGVLEVRVPKPEEVKPRRIQLGSGHADVESGARAA